MRFMALAKINIDHNSGRTDNWLKKHSDTFGLNNGNNNSNDFFPSITKELCSYDLAKR